MLQEDVKQSVYIQAVHFFWNIQDSLCTRLKQRRTNLIIWKTANIPFFPIFI